MRSLTATVLSILEESYINNLNKIYLDRYKIEHQVNFDTKVHGE